MLKVYDDKDIQSIANAIREKTGKEDTMKVSEMADEISNISGGGIAEKCDYIMFMPNYNTYIRTDIAITATMRIEVDFQEVAGGGSYGAIWGLLNSDSKGGNLARDSRKWYTATNNDEMSFGNVDLNRHNFIWHNKNNEYIMDGVVVGKSASIIPYLQSDLLTLGGRSGIYSYGFCGKIFSLKVINNNTDEVLHNLIPYRFKSGLGFLYDDITGKVYFTSYTIGGNE